MNLATSKRIALTVGAAALCIGIGAPALACPPNPSSISAVQNAAAHKPKITEAEALARQQAWVDSFVAHAQAVLDKVAAKVAADPDLTAAKKTAISAKLVQAQGVLATLKEKADAATTLDALHDAVRDAIMTWRSDLAAATAMRMHKENQSEHHKDTRALLAAAVKARHEHARFDAAAVQHARDVAARFGRNGDFRGYHWGRSNGHRFHNHHHGGGFGGHHQHG